jgi:hypothetical protein
MADNFGLRLGNANADITNLTENLVDAFGAVVANIVPVLENIIAALPPAFFISLLCPSPFFESLDDIRAELASWQENFHFPFEITAPSIELGIRQPSQIITIERAMSLRGVKLCFTLSVR